MTRDVNRLRVVLADSHPLWLAGLRSVLEHDGGFSVVGVAGEGEQAVSLVLGLSADLLVVGDNPPHLDGRRVAERIVHGGHGHSRVVLLVSDPRRDGPTPPEGVEVLPRNCSCEEVVEAAGRCRRAPSMIASRVLWTGDPRRASAGVSAVARPHGPAGRLTPREREVLALLAEGWAMKDIARRLHLSRKTIETHRRRMSEKLGIGTVAGLTKYAVLEGLTSLEGCDAARQTLREAEGVEQPA